MLVSRSMVVRGLTIRFLAPPFDSLATLPSQFDSSLFPGKGVLVSAWLFVKIRRRQGRAGERKVVPHKFKFLTPSPPHNSIPPALPLDLPPPHSQFDSSLSPDKGMLVSAWLFVKIRRRQGRAGERKVVPHKFKFLTPSPLTIRFLPHSPLIRPLPTHNSIPPFPLTRACW